MARVDPARFSLPANAGEALADAAQAAAQARAAARGRASSIGAPRSPATEGGLRRLEKGSTAPVGAWKPPPGASLEPATFGVGLDEVRERAAQAHGSDGLQTLAEQTPASVREGLLSALARERKMLAVAARYAELHAAVAAAMGRNERA